MARKQMSWDPSLAILQELLAEVRIQLLFWERKDRLVSG